MSTPEEAKARGSSAWKDGDLSQAIMWFSKAIELDPSNASGQLHVYYSNRSAAQLKDNNLRAALLDAEECVKVNPSWAKGYSRLGTARFRLGMHGLAAAAYTKGLELEPANDEMRKNLLEAQRKQATGGAAHTSASGGQRQSIREYMKREPSQSFQFLLRGFILLNLIMFLLPVRSLSRGAYRRMLLAVLAVNILAAIGRQGMPKISKHYLITFMKDPSIQVLITTLLFLTQRPYFVGIIPIVLIELVDFMWFLSGALQMISPVALRILDSRIEKFAPALFGVTNWTSKRIHDRWFLVREKASQWSGSVEVMFGILLIVELVLPRRNMIMLALYWQTLRMKYMMEAAAGTYRIRTAFQRVDVRIISITNHPRCPSFAGAVYGKIKHWLGAMVELPQAGSQTTRPSCCVM